MSPQSHSLDTLKAMRKQLQVYSVPADYIPDYLDDSEVDEYVSWRYAIVGWLFEMRDIAKFEEETIETSLSILDRYVAAKPELVLDAEAYHRAAFTSVYITTKIHEEGYLTPDHFKLLSDNMYTIEMIEKEETVILNAINWRVNPPTPSAIADEMLNVIPSKMIPRNQIEELFNDQIQQMLYEEYFVTEDDCKLAMAALYNALQLAPEAKKLPKFVELRVLDAAGLGEDDSAEILRLRALLVGVSDRIEPIPAEEKTEEEVTNIEQALSRPNTRIFRTSRTAVIATAG